MTTFRSSAVGNINTEDMTEKEITAAIALAISDYEAEYAHDNESYIITIQKPEFNAWGQKQFTMRKRPSTK